MLFFLFYFIFAVIGFLVVCLILLESLWSPFEYISSYLMPYFLPSEVKPLVKRFGPWAAVTGSTDGIGKHYALELARKGFNVVLISRNQEKLKAVAKEIETKHNVKTMTVVADFSKGAEVYPHIEEELKNVPIGVLVNNVGTQYEYPMPLCELPTSAIWEIINVNVVPVTVLTRMLLPAMVERGRGAVVNVSSASELQPIPLVAVYAASKVYVQSFTTAIQGEYKNKGIYIQHLCPFFVSTKMNSFSKSLLKGNMLVPDAESYARQAVSTLGRVHNTTGYWAHGIQCFFTKLPPVWLRTVIGTGIFQGFRDEYHTNNEQKVH